MSSTSLTSTYPAFSIRETADGADVSKEHKGSKSRTGSRPDTRMSRRTAGSTIGGGELQEIICAVSEARGASPTVGLAFINLTTSEAVISQICDNSSYARTINKIQLFEPTEILMMTTALPPQTATNLYSIIRESCSESKLVTANRNYWSETSGLESIQNLSLLEDVEALKISIGANFYSTCCLAAALKYIETVFGLSFSRHSLRIRYQPSEGTMAIDLSTIQSMELIQNLQSSKSTHSLFGLMNKTQSAMGSRCLRSNLLQPSTDEDILNARYDALEELTSKEEMFFETRQALRSFVDVDKLLTRLVLNPVQPNIQHAEQSINNVLMLKNFVKMIEPVHDALANATSPLLLQISQLCQPGRLKPTMDLIGSVINDDVNFCKGPLDLKHQRTYAVKSGVNGLLDVARMIFKEATGDVHQHLSSVNQEHNLQAELRYDNSRRYYLRVRTSILEEVQMPEIIINRYRKKDCIECQTLELMKLNQRIEDSHQEVVLGSDKMIQELLDGIRGEMSVLFRVCDGIAMLDMLAGFAHLVSIHNYSRPELTEDDIVIKAGRHPIREEVHSQKFVPNDFYATQQTRFQILTGCNMSGKSTYIRSIALITIMAQVGCFVPAEYASIVPMRQIFARVSMDDSIEANVSTFAAEMRETAFILRNIHKQSMVIIDELGRGTSTRDGLAIAIAIAEALINSHAFVWFATHFRELAEALSERNGVINLHLQVTMDSPDRLTMLYKLKNGFVRETHYGLALARVVDLPPQVLALAEKVSHTLEEQMKAKKMSSKALGLIRRRKLVLGLRESLQQAKRGNMDDKTLLNWLRKLQEEFVKRMELINNDMEEGNRDSSFGAGTDSHNTEDEMSRA